MAEELVTFDRDDLQTLKQMAQAYRTGVVNPQSRPATSGGFLDTEEQQSPQVYIAYVDDDEIPALDGTQTGTGDTDRPGYAECRIYTIVEDASGPKMQDAGFSRRVYNFTSGAISQGYIAIHRTCFGHWVPSVAGDACSLLKLLDGYDENAKQAVVHLPADESGACQWQTIVQCSTEVGTGTGS